MKYHIVCPEEKTCLINMPDLVVQTIQTMTDRIRYFSVYRPDGGVLPGYTAGAHIQINTVGDSLRAYSLIDFTPPETSPTCYRFAVQLEPDGQGGSQFMHALKVGDLLHSTEPENSFSLIDDHRPVLLLAGGIGITPLISMATELHHSRKPFELHYSSRSADAMAFRNELMHHFGENGLSPHIYFYYDDISDRTLDLTALFSKHSSDEHVYICGPRGMIDAARACAEDEGLPASQIHVELFDTPATDDSDGAFEVQLKSSGEIYRVPKDKTIIDVLEAAGIDTVYDCQRGDCGICQTTVLEGEIDHRDVVLSSAERAQGDVMQICVSRAKSSRLVLDL